MAHTADITDITLNTLVSSPEDLVEATEERQAWAALFRLPVVYTLYRLSVHHRTPNGLLTFFFGFVLFKQNSKLASQFGKRSQLQGPVWKLHVLPMSL